MTYFAESYTQARQEFLAAAARANAHLSCYTVPDLRGVEGEALTVDVAELGAADASHVALVVTGTHGAEGYAGSAILRRWLNSQPAVPSKIKLVLVHAVNPWSFSFKTRTTENNVDLNRNFRTSWLGLENPAYIELVRFLHVPPLDAQVLLRTYQSYRAHLNMHGWHLENEMLRGQTDLPDGLFYPGTGPEWANTNFRHLLQTHVANASHVGFIDFHTGLGEFGDVVHLVFAPNGSEARQHAMRWWGLDGSGGSLFRAGSLPDYQGLLCHAISHDLPGRKVAGAVIEFGTADAYGVFRADCSDRWLRNEGRDHPAAPALRDQYRDACTPRDLAWCNLVLDKGPSSIDALLTGVAGWN